MAALLAIGLLSTSPCASAAEGAQLALSDIHLRDPFILPVPEEKRYYLFGTIAHIPPGPGFDCFTSRDLKHWEGPFKAFRPDEGFWSDRDYWAPEVHRHKGRYYMFASFNAEGKRRGTQILASDQPGGPYSSHSDGPVTPREWECLDGTLYMDQEGAPWMVFCHEWVQIEDGTICAVRLTPELDKAVGEPRTLFAASEAPWVKEFSGVRRGIVTDGPFLHRTKSGVLLMVWSSFGEKGYALTVARSESGTLADGPWIQADEPLYADDGGHGMLFRTLEGQLMLVLHQPNSRNNERPRLFEVEEIGEELRITPWG